VSLDLNARRGGVALHDLPPLPPSRMDRLWAVAGAQTVPCGAFGIVVDGRLVAQFAMPADACVAPIGRLFPTVEPATLPPAPTGPTVMERGRA